MAQDPGLSFADLAPSGRGRVLYTGPIEVRVTPAGPMTGVGLLFTGGELTANEARDLVDELDHWLRGVGR